MKKLRDYQIECSDAVMRKFLTETSTAVYLFTSGGKTVIFAEIIRRFIETYNGRVLVLAGQDKLIHQANKVIQEWTGIPCDVEMASQRADNSPGKRHPIVLATWQSLISRVAGEKQNELFPNSVTRRMHRFKPTDFDLIVIDEFHHAAAASYRRILDYFSLNPNHKRLGVTATPKRGDGVALATVCQSVAFQYPINEGARDGWLVDYVQYCCKLGMLDYSHIKKTAGELNNAQLKAVLEAEENVAGMCHPCLEVMYGLQPHSLDSVPVPEWGAHLKALGRVPRRTIFFAKTVAQAQRACAIFNRVIPGIAEWVCGKTNATERAAIFERFESGQTALLANVGITVEGYDCPPVEVLAMARPTLSISTYVQMMGRGGRVLPGVIDGLETKEERLAAIAASAKPRVRVIDYVGNHGRHTIMNAFNVLGGKMSPDAIRRAVKECTTSNKPKSVLRELNKAEIAIEEEKRKALEKRRQDEEARKKMAVPKSNFQWKEVNAYGSKGKAPMPTYSNHGELTDKQFNFIRNHYPEMNPNKVSKKQYGFLIAKKLKEWDDIRKRRAS